MKGEATRLWGGVVLVQTNLDYFGIKSGTISLF